MNSQQMKQQQQLAMFAIGGTFFIWFVAMVLSYESQVEFAISIGMTSTIFGVSKAYAFPILTDTVIFVSAAWSLLAALQGLPNVKYRIANLFFGGVTIWFNTHSIDLSQANYTAIFAVAWIPGMVIISTEMLLSHFQQQVELQREYVGKETNLEHRIIALETVTKLSPNLALTVAGDATNDEDNDILPSPLDKAREAKQAKKQANIDKTLQMLNEGKSVEYIAETLELTPQTIRGYKAELNGHVKLSS